VKPTNIKLIISRIVKLITEYPQGSEEVKVLAKSHVHLKLSELELMELERVFLSVEERTREYLAKMRTVFGDFTRYLREQNGISTNLFEENGGNGGDVGVLAEYDYYDLLSDMNCYPLLTNLN